MPILTQDINNYANGATGTITDDDGETVSYTISGNARNTTGGNTEPGDNSAAVYSYDGFNSYFDVTFERPVKGLLVQMTGSDRNEVYAIRIDGEVVDLNQMIRDGEAIFTTTGPGNHRVDPVSGHLTSVGTNTDGSFGYVEFTIPISTIGIEGKGPVYNGGFDYFEIGVVPNVDIVCFCAGAMIDTSEGSRPVETLQAGDLILTLDHGPQPLRWTGESRLDRVDLALAPKLRPIRIRAGALAPGLPERDLLVSRQHRFLLRSTIALDLFGSSEILVPAVKLLGLEGVEVVEDAQAVSYWHVLLDRHELIFSEGAITESLYSGKEALKAIPADARAELIALGFWDAEADQPAAMARREIRNNKAVARLLSRHAEQQVPLFSDGRAGVRW